MKASGFKEVNYYAKVNKNQVVCQKSQIMFFRVGYNSDGFPDKDLKWISYDFNGNLIDSLNLLS
jgi:hypothetical protein